MPHIILTSAALTEPCTAPFAPSLHSLWQQVAAQGDTVAQVNLAMIYESGDKGVPRDLEKAKEW